jgi:hypothetical protein
MMTTTHALFGASLGAATAVVAPALTPAAVVVGFLGGALPDADLLGTHRRSTHFPVYGTAIAVPFVGVAALAGTGWATLLAVFVAAAASHSLMDAFGGGVELRPWEATSEQGVYNHAGGYWVRPRRWVRYAGAPEDFALAAGVALPAIAVTTGRLRAGLLAVVVVSGLFASVRRRLTGVSRRLFAGDADGR